MPEGRPVVGMSKNALGELRGHARAGQIRPQGRAQTVKVRHAIIGNLSKATSLAISLIKAAVERIGEIADVQSPAHSALELAIWSDKTKIPPAAAEHLGVLVEKYLA